MEDEYSARLFFCTRGLKCVDSAAPKHLHLVIDCEDGEGWATHPIRSKEEAEVVFRAVSQEEDFALPVQGVSRSELLAELPDKASDEERRELEAWEALGKTISGFWGGGR